MASGDYVVGRDIDFHVSPGPSRPAFNAALAINLPASAKKKARKRAKKKKSGVEPSYDDGEVDSALYPNSAGDFIDRDNTLPLWDFDPSIAKLTAVPAQIKRLKHNPFQKGVRKSSPENNSPFTVEDVIEYRSKLELEHREIEKFWQALSPKQRESLARIEKAEIYNVIHMERRECDCELCESKKDAIDAELDALYDVNYPIIEQYTNRLLSGELMLSEELTHNRAPEYNKTGMSFHDLKALNFKIPRAHNEYSDIHGTTVHNDAVDKSQPYNDVAEPQENSSFNLKSPEIANEASSPCTCADVQFQNSGDDSLRETDETSNKFTASHGLASLCSDEFMQKIYNQINFKMELLNSPLSDAKIAGTCQGLPVTGPLVQGSDPKNSEASPSITDGPNLKLLSSIFAANKLSSAELTRLIQIDIQTDANKPEQLESSEKHSLKLNNAALCDKDLDTLADSICGQLGVHRDNEKSLIQLITGILPLFTVNDLTEEDRYRILSRLMESGKEHKDLFFGMIAQLATDLLGNNGSEIIEVMESLQKSDTAEESSSIVSDLIIDSLSTPEISASSENRDLEHNPENLDSYKVESGTSSNGTAKPKKISNIGDSGMLSQTDLNKCLSERHFTAKSPAEQKVHDYYKQLRGEVTEAEYSGTTISKMDKKSNVFDIEVEISDSSENNDIPDAPMYEPRSVSLPTGSFNDSPMDVNHPLHEYFPDYTGAGIERTLPPDHANHTPSNEVESKPDHEDTTTLRNENGILIDKEQNRLAKASWYLQNLYARIFEVRILTVYREHVAKMRQRLLLAELAAEEERANNEALRKAREKDKKKSKKLLARQLRQEEEKKKAMEEKRKQEELKAKEEARRIQQLEMDRAKQEAHRRKIEKRMAQLELDSRNVAGALTNVSPQDSPKRDLTASGKGPDDNAKKENSITNKAHEASDHPSTNKNVILDSGGVSNRLQSSKPGHEKSKVAEVSKITKIDGARIDSNNRAVDHSRLEKERAKLERQTTKKLEKLEKAKSEKLKSDKTKAEKAVEKASVRPKSKTTTPASSQPAVQVAPNATLCLTPAATKQLSALNIPDSSTFTPHKQNMLSNANSFVSPKNNSIPPGMPPQLGHSGPTNTKLPLQASMPILLETGLSSNMDMSAALNKNAHISRSMMPQTFGFSPPGMVGIPKIAGVPKVPGMRMEAQCELVAPVHPSPGGHIPLGLSHPVNLNTGLGSNISTFNGGARGIGANLGGKISANIGPNVNTNINASLNNGNLKNNTLSGLHSSFTPNVMPSKKITNGSAGSPISAHVARPSVPMNRAAVNSPSQSNLPLIPGMSNLWSPVSNTPSPKIPTQATAGNSWSRSPWSEPGNSELNSSPVMTLGSSPWANNNHQPSESEIVEAARKGYNEVKNLGVDGLVPSQVLFHAVKSKLAMKITQQDLFRALAAHKSARLIRDDVGLVTHIKL